MWSSAFRHHSSVSVTADTDLAIVGYNDTDLAPMLPVPLSSVAVPLAEMGRLAVDVLVERLNDPTAAIDGRTFTP